MSVTSTTPKLKLEILNHTALIKIDNPAANTWDTESLGALPKIVRELDQDPNVWSLIITGTGPKFFSAGADLKLFKDGDKAMARLMARLFGAAFESLASFKGLSIAAINGFAMGGGLECAMACDLRIAEDHAQLALPEATVGLMPCAGGTQNLTWLVGEAWAKRMMMMGERVSAEKALSIGLVDEVVPSGSSLEKALAFCKKSENQSPQSLFQCKKLIQAGRKNPMFHNLTVEREAFVDLFDTEDQREGTNAFLEKRSAVWKNK
jgi:enoyl-CoA hydratase/carnithine racemase